MTLWRYSLLLLLFVSVGAWCREPVDRVALVIGERAVTLSEVRAWYSVHTGRPLPPALTVRDRQLITRMIAIERLYEVAELYGVFRLDDEWFRLAVYMMDELSGFRLSNPAWQRQNQVAPGVLVDVLRRNLRVFRFVQARVGLMGTDRSLTVNMQVLADREATDVSVTNYLF